MIDHKFFPASDFPQVAEVNIQLADGGRSLANKETDLAHLIGQPLGGWSKQNRMLGRRKLSSDGMPAPLRSRCNEALTQDGRRLESPW